MGRHTGTSPNAESPSSWILTEVIPGDQTFKTTKGPGRYISKSTNIVSPGSWILTEVIPNDQT